MKTEIVFGDRWIEAEVPDHTRIVNPGYGLAKLEAAENQEKAIVEGILNPIDLDPISEIAKKGSKVTVAFDDPTVPCYGNVWEIAIKTVMEELKKAGVSKSDVRLICANALHRKFRMSELEKILGWEIIEAYGDRITCHDAEDKENIVYLGETENGYEVEVNRAVAESDLVIYVNTFASAFNGGWKSVCVGLSTWRSIRWHHTPEIMSMSSERNRLHEILDEMGKLVQSEIKGEIFKVETVMANPIRVSRVLSGSVDACRKEVVRIWKERALRRRDLLDEKVDVVCYGIPNWSPYAAFSIMNPILTLISTGLGYLGGVIEALGKKGCSVVLATPCPDRWDVKTHASYPEVWRILGKTRDVDEIMERYEDYFANHKEYIRKYRQEFAFHPVHGLMATHPLKRLKHASQIIVAGIEDAGTAKHLNFEVAETVGDGIKMAEEVHGKDASVCLVRYPLMLSRQ